MFSRPHSRVYKRISLSCQTKPLKTRSQTIKLSLERLGRLTTSKMCAAGDFDLLWPPARKSLSKSCRRWCKTKAIKNRTLWVIRRKVSLMAARSQPLTTSNLLRPSVRPKHAGLSFEAIYNRTSSRRKNRQPAAEKRLRRSSSPSSLNISSNRLLSTARCKETKRTNFAAQNLTKTRGCQ